MKIEFENGSVVESIETTNVYRGKTRKEIENIILSSFKLKWYQKIYIKIYAKINGLFSRL